MSHGHRTVITDQKLTGDALDEHKIHKRSTEPIAGLTAPLGWRLTAGGFKSRSTAIPDLLAGWLALHPSIVQWRD